MDLLLMGKVKTAFGCVIETDVSGKIMQPLEPRIATPAFCALRSVQILASLSHVLK